jgi:hypothetical protein
MLSPRSSWVLALSRLHRALVDGELFHTPRRRSVGGDPADRGFLVQMGTGSAHRGQGWTPYGRVPSPTSMAATVSRGLAFLYSAGRPPRALAGRDGADRGSTEGCPPARRNGARGETGPRPENPGHRARCIQAYGGKRIRLSPPSPLALRSALTRKIAHACFCARQCATCVHIGEPRNNEAPHGQARSDLSRAAQAEGRRRFLGTRPRVT